MTYLHRVKIKRQTGGKMGNVKYACAIWPWGTKTREQFIEALRDAREAGYSYVESTKPTIGLFQDDFPAFRNICGEYGIRAVSFYFHMRGTRENDIDDLRNKLDFMKKAGVECISIQALGTGDSKASPEQLRYTLDTVVEMSELCSLYGIQPCLHPHCNTSVMYEDEIDFIMNNTDPDLLFFGPDTAHLLGGGCDPADIFRRYADRIRFTHMKDLKGTKAKTEENVGGIDVYSNFTELGNGDVDFESVFDVLKDIGYDGYLTSELDQTTLTNKESARINLEFMKKYFG